MLNVLCFMLEINAASLNVFECVWSRHLFESHACGKHGQCFEVGYKPVDISMLVNKYSTLCYKTISVVFWLT